MAEVQLNKIQQAMEKLGTPSLKAIATTFDVNPVRLYTVAKQAKEGVVYDPKVYNWDAIERWVERRLTDGTELATLEDVIKRALEIDVELKEADGRRSANRGLGVNKKVEVDGKMIDERKFKNFDINEKKPVCLKKDPNVFAIVMQTKSHTVLRPIKSEKLDDFASEAVITISNGRLNTRGVGPANIDTAIKERLDGTYAKMLAEEAAKAAAAAEQKAQAKS